MRPKAPTTRASSRSFFREGIRTPLRRLVLALFTAFAPLSGFTVSVGAQDVDCPQISYERAQEILAEDPSDPNGLDRDNDGEACENNARSGSSADSATDDDSAADASATDDGATDDGSDDGEASELPNTGTGALVDAGVSTSALLFATIAAFLGLTGLRIARR